jgi:hypothetical protein
MTTRYNTPSFNASPRAVATASVNKLDSISRNPDIITKSKPIIIERKFQGDIPVTVYAPQNERRSYRFNNGYQRVPTDISFGFSELRNA